MPNGMIEPDHPDLSIGQQCCLLSIARSSFSSTPKGETALNLGLMPMDEQFLDTPFFGAGQMTWHLPSADAPHASDADLPKTRYQQAGEGPQDLSLSAERVAGGPAQPGLVRRHHLSADAAWAFPIWWPVWTGSRARCWPGASRTRWKPSSASGPEPGHPYVRPARDHEHRPGQPVHIL